MELPSQFGRYLVKKKLGGGGMGSVYLVENTELEREEALKVPHFGDGADTELRARFLREARSAAKLEHANLCPVYDAGVQDGIYYMTMRFLNGKLLSDYAGKAQPARKAVEIVTKLAQALDAAHGKGVIHRDLKPSNVMMVPGVGPVVMDFGLAKQIQQADQKLTQMGSTLGTPAYMPPEQVNGDLERMGPASDVYSLGVILYELLTGRLPFEGTTASIYGQILYTEAPLPSAFVPGLNAALDGICRQAMAKAPTERYPSMKAFAAALVDYLRSTPATDGAGSLVPAAGEKAAIFQASTAAPGQRLPGQADIFLAPTVVPQASNSLPTTTGAKDPSAIHKPGRSRGIVLAAGCADIVEDWTKRWASFATKPVRMFVVILVLGALAGVGWLTHTAMKTAGPRSDLVVEATPPKSSRLPEAASPPPRTPARPVAPPTSRSRRPTSPRDAYSKQVAEKLAARKSPRQMAPKSVNRDPKSSGAAPKTVLVPEKVTQPEPTVHDNYHVRALSCLQQNDGMTCALLITDLVGDRVIKTQNGGNASAIFANGEAIRQAGMRIGDKRGYALFQGVRMHKDVPLLITIGFKNVPRNAPEIVLLDLGFWSSKIALRKLQIQQVVEAK